MLVRSMRLTFQINMMKYVSLLVVFVFAWLYISEYIHYSILLIVLILNIGLMINRFILASLPRTYVDGQFADLMESVQFFFIALKFIRIINFSWENVTIIYSIYIYFILYFGILCAFMFPIMIGMSFFHPAGSNDRKTLQLSSWVFFHIVWKGICLYYLYENLLIFLNSDGLVLGEELWETDLTLVPFCIALFVGGVVNIIWFYDQKDLFTRIISIKMMIVGKNKGVKRVIAEVPFDLKIMKAGSNYFKDLISTRKIPDTFSLTNNNEENGFVECMICCTNDPNILIRPCNHGGICEDCIITYLGTNDCCPNCKAKITKIYVMNYDKKTKKYIGEKVLTLV